MVSEQDLEDGLDRIGEALVKKNAQIASLTAENERLRAGIRNILAWPMDKQNKTTMRKELAALLQPESNDDE